VYSRADGWQITLGGDDFFANTAERCPIPTGPPPCGGYQILLDPSERDLLFNKVAVHEMGHGVACPHELSDCQSITWWPSNLMPLEFFFSTPSTETIRLHANP
jgi:hypothetical protein